MSSKLKLLILEIVILYIASHMAVVWFGWKMFWILMFFGWYVNLANTTKNMK